VTTFIGVLSERFARQRLQAMAKIESSEPGTPSVLFLCVHNAGRSQMAAGWLRALAGDQVNVYTGGSEPGAELNPEVVEVMAESGIDIHEEFPKPWTDEIVRAVDIVIAMGCGDVCPSTRGSVTSTGTSLIRRAKTSAPFEPSVTKFAPASKHS